jgi:xanthine dehydrogenase accessory factor
MSELLPVLETLVADADAGRPVAICTVVKTRGSTPQSPGASMLVRADGSTLGTLGGGCVEAEVRKQAFQMLQQSRSGLLDYLLNHDYGWDDGLICGGRMFIGVMPVRQAVGRVSRPDMSDPERAVRQAGRPDPGGRASQPASPTEAEHGSSDRSAATLDSIREALEHARRREPTWFPLVVQREGQCEEYRVHLEVPPMLLIAGAGHVGHALAKLAVELDFRVVVIDDRADYASRERFGPKVELVVDDIARALRHRPIDRGTYVVIVTRGHQHDHQALEAVIRSNAGYIGLIGSKRKSRMILRDLGESGVEQERLDAVHTPIGLEIGAITVPEIAVSIAAELVQHRRRTAPVLVEGPL